MMKTTMKKKTRAMINNGDADNNQGVDDDVRAFLSLAGSLKD
jgi:hypothetical protein